MTESGWLAAIVVVVVVAAGVASRTRSVFRARFAHDRDLLLALAAPPAPLVTDDDLAALPPLMQTYLRRVGAVGRAHVRNVRVTFSAQMRSSATSWRTPVTCSAGTMRACSIALASCSRRSRTKPLSLANSSSTHESV